MYSSIFVSFLIYVHICSSQMVFLSNSSFVHYTASFFLHSSLSRKVCSKKSAASFFRISLANIYSPHFLSQHQGGLLKSLTLFEHRFLCFWLTSYNNPTSVNCVGRTFRANTTYSYSFAAYSLCENKLLIGFTWSHLF